MPLFPRRQPPRIRFSLAWLLVAFTAACVYIAWHANSVTRGPGVEIERPTDADAPQRR